ncbi:penicillin-binding protein 2 [Spirosomataceae bacterium TFI 002]|nr:penicillin-binding protein 2 [Spirosomataceae bacterium TFI 002]
MKDRILHIFLSPNNGFILIFNELCIKILQVFDMLDNRRFIILFFFTSIGVVYILRLFYLQVLDPKYKSLEATNAIKREIEIPLRGQVYDRNGKLIVTNEEVYDMYVTPNKVKDLDTLKFCRVFNVTRGYFDSTLANAVDFSPRRASLFLRQLTKNDYASTIDAMVHFKGFYFEQSFFRKYPPATMANALGYIAEIPKKMYDSQEVPYYRKGDYIGLSGLEKQYEIELRGTRGVKYTLMNVKGEDKGQYENGEYDTLAVVGKNLYSTIDLDIQQLADSLFEGKVGALVAIEPNTGEILAIGSYPTYDPNVLAGKLYSENYVKLSKDPDKPFLNRAISSFYRPGSTFKLVQAVIGLNEGVITPSTSFAGSPSPFQFHSGPREAANLTVGIQLSSNPYFYNVYKRIIENTKISNPFLGARETLFKWGNTVKKFGFGVKLGIDIPGENNGLIPTVELYDKYYGKDRWKFSNFYSVSIGEGEFGVNVLKLANLAATIANRGYWVTPHLVKGIGNEKGTTPKSNSEIHQTGIAAKHFESIMDGMEQVVLNGTGRRAQIEGIRVMGKTGTSQNKKGKDHAIFITFAPRDNPKIAIAAIVENGGYGGTASAPITSLIMEKYLTGTIKRTAVKEATKNARYTTVAGKKANLPEAE